MRTQTLLLFLLFFCYTASGSVFLKKNDASSILQRFRRANSGYFEELKSGNLESECFEEICDYEEAREVFEDDAITKIFWLKYPAREPCLRNPCKNNGTCIYFADSYMCQCLEGFEGKYCQEVFEDTLKCLYLNGGCEQFCDGSGRRRKCKCAPGYALGEDGKSCIAQVQYPCGKAPLKMSQTLIPWDVSGNQCPKGHCPWQVLLDYNGESLCGGALVDAGWVITAAHCVDKKNLKSLKVIAGINNIDIIDGTGQIFSVSQVIVHEKYDSESEDSDIALLRLRQPAVLSNYTVPICLPTAEFATRELAAVRFHSISGWGQRTRGGNVKTSQISQGLTSPMMRVLAVPLLPEPECMLKSGVNITDNMFCAGYFEGRKESCQGNDGSPLATEYRETTFLTGIVSWGKGCTHPGFYGIYTKVSNFLDWIQNGIATPAPREDADATSPHTTPPIEQFVLN